MKHEPEKYVAAIVAAAGGRIVSRIRMQKIAYLLDQLGMGSEFEYTYHHYGPYSRDLDNAILDAEAFDLVEEKFQHRVTDGAKYSVFESSKPFEENIFGSSIPKGKDLIKDFSKTNVTVLELAATAHWLLEIEKVSNWQVEIKNRKGSKTESGRLEEAIELLKKINLKPSISISA